MLTDAARPTSNLITVANSTKLGFVQQPTTMVAGATMTRPVQYEHAEPGIRQGHVVRVEI